MWPASPFEVGLMLKPLKSLARDLEAARPVVAPPAAPPVVPANASITVHMAEEDPRTLPFSRGLAPGAPGSFKPLPSSSLAEARANFAKVLGNEPVDKERPTD